MGENEPEGNQSRGKENQQIRRESKITLVSVHLN